MGIQLKRGSCKCTVHQSLSKLSLHKPNGHTLHNLMRVNCAMYNEVEAAMHRLVPILVFLKGPTDGEKDWGEPDPHKLKASSKVLVSLRHTRSIILQSALPSANNDDEEGDISEIFTFFDWWYARSRSQGQLRVRLGELTHPYFDALDKLDSWLSEQPRDLGNMRFVFYGIENCEESIRTCVVTYEECAPGIFNGPSLNNDSMERVRWFCRRHPGLIESGTDWANVEEKEKDEYGYEKMVQIYTRL